MGKPSAPKAPSPTATAAAQTSSNVGTAIAQQQLNMIGQTGPQGSVTYNQTGTYKFTDPSSGKVYDLPMMTQKTTLSPEQMKLYQTGVGTQQNLADLAKSQSGRLEGLLSKPLDLSNEAVEARLMELASARLNPALDRRRQQEIARLSNMGVKDGSEAFTQAMARLSEGENDAYNQLLLSGRGQAVQEALIERQTPLNEIIALASGTQTQMPQYAPTVQTGLAGTDVAGIAQGAYNGQLASYGQQMNQYNSTMGGLFGLGANALMAFSDRRLKEDIKPTGEKVAGVPVKSWTWKGSGERDVGVIAQDLEKKHPELVDHSHPSGYRRVNYGGLMQLGATAKARAA